MADNYYLKLVRVALIKAEAELLNAQDYLKNAGTSAELHNRDVGDGIKYAQDIINKTRKLRDRLV